VCRKHYYEALNSGSMEAIFGHRHLTSGS